MPKAGRKGDVGSAHGCAPASNAITGSPDVFINGQPALRVGDAFAVHGCPSSSPHGRAAAAGSSTVNINGLPAVRVGDAIDCGGVLETGSGNVFIGDTSWSGSEPMPEMSSMRLSLSNASGTLDRPYPNEPYQLYKDGTMVQTGNTDEAGYIHYKYQAPWTSELKVKTAFGEYTFTPEANLPAETDIGQQQRLGLLGYHNQYHDEAPITQPHLTPAQLFFGDTGKTKKEEENPLFSRIKSLVP